MASWPHKFLLEPIRVSCHCDSAAGVDGTLLGAWPGQGVAAHGDVPGAPVELTWLPEVRMVKWVMGGSKKPREAGPCWVAGS